MIKKKLKISDLVIDPKLVELRHINPVVVSRYRQAYRNGASMPLIVIEKDTNRVVSGNHRLTALKEEYDNNDIIAVEERSYSSECELIKDFYRENATHGMPLDGFSKKLIVRALLNEGATVEEVAQLFNVPVKCIEMYGEDTVMVTIGDRTESMPAKRGFEPDNPITAKAYEGHVRGDKGFPLSAQINQLMRWITEDQVRRDDKNIQMLKTLRNEIDRWLKRNAKSKAA